MSARRKLGEYTLIMKWEPNNSGYQPWIVGHYKWSIRRTGRNRGGDSGWFHVWRDESPNFVGASLADLGFAESALDKKAAYDEVALRIIRRLRARHPNMIHYQELLAYAYVNALKSGAIDNDDLSKAPERTQMLVDQLLGVK